MRAMFRLVVLVLVSGTLAFASGGPPAGIGDRTRRAKKVVVARVASVESSFGTNDHGDQLILSRVTLDVEETLKGSHANSVSMTVEGGTVGELTLKVSDMPAMKRGERAVLFLDETYDGHVPADRGHGIVRLDRSNHVADTQMTLDDVRALVRGAGR